MQGVYVIRVFWKNAQGVEKFGECNFFDKSVQNFQELAKIFGRQGPTFPYSDIDRCQYDGMLARPKRGYSF